MDEQIRGRVVLVTGGSAGIGKALALLLASRGATVALAARDPATLRATAAECGGAAFECDMGDPLAVQRLAAGMLERFGKVDILIHNAAAYIAGSVETASLADFDYQWNVNVRGVFQLTQLLLPTLRQQRGQVLFINSSAGARSHANVSQYAATKFALKAIADALREEVNAAGVRVITLFPGRTATPLQARIMRDEGRPWCPDKLLQADDVAAVAVNALALPRTAEVTDVHVRPMEKHP